MKHPRSATDGAQARGSDAMPIPWRVLYGLGACRHRLAANICGGSSVSASRHVVAVGAANAALALAYLRARQRPAQATDAFDSQSRVVHYLPASGRVRIRRMTQEGGAPSPRPACASVVAARLRINGHGSVLAVATDRFVSPGGDRA